MQKRSIHFRVLATSLVLLGVVFIIYISTANAQLGNPTWDMGETTGFGNVPVGTVQAWLKSFPNTPSLPAGWVEANGQVISDSQSPFNGQAVPNLNGANSSTKRLLRGSTASGATGSGIITGSTSTVGASEGTGQSGPHSHTYNDIVPQSDWYEIVWIIKVKDNTGGLMSLEDYNNTNQAYTSDASNVSNFILNDATGVNAVEYQASGYVVEGSLNFEWKISIEDCSSNKLTETVAGISAGEAEVQENSIPFYISYIDDNPSSGDCWSLNLDETRGSATLYLNQAKLTKIMA